MDLNTLKELLQLPATALLIAFLAYALIRLYNDARAILPLIVQVTQALANFSKALERFSEVLDRQNQANSNMVERLAQQYEREHPGVNLG